MFELNSLQWENPIVWAPVKATISWIVNPFEANSLMSWVTDIVVPGILPSKRDHLEISSLTN